MDEARPGQRVRIYIGEHDHAAGAHRPLWEELLLLLRDEGAAGATMFRGLAGFGAHSHLHLARVADLVPDLPVVVEWIDTPEQVDRLLPMLQARVSMGLITVDDVTIAHFRPRQPNP